MKSVLVTGATGFVGRFLCAELVAKGWLVRAAIKGEEDIKRLPQGVKPVITGFIGPDTEWVRALSGVEIVFHLSARVHVVNEQASDPMSAFLRDNVAATERLAREAAAAGVKRLVFTSTIKVNGDVTSEPITQDSPPRPTDPYSISKWEAEQILRAIDSDTALEVVVVRPPLVYGPEVKANFLTLMKIVHCGMLLPLASVSNKRSLIYVENLVDALIVCAGHPAAAGKTYLVSDGDDVSTPELVRRLASGLRKPARLIPFPPSLLRLAGRITGNSAAVDRLLFSLFVDSGKICKDLDWQPPFPMMEGLRKTGEWFLRTLKIYG